MNMRRGYVLRLIWRAAVLLGAIAGAAPVAAEQAGMQPGMDARPPAQMSGIIASVDPRRGRLSVDEKLSGRPSLDRAKQFVIGTDTSIARPDGRAGLQLIELSPGDRVTVHYREQDGRNLAASITVNPSAPAVPPASISPPSEAPADAE